MLRTLLASLTMVFERQTAVRAAAAAAAVAAAAAQSSAAVKVVVLFQLRQPEFSIMSVSLCCKGTFVSWPLSISWSS